MSDSGSSRRLPQQPIAGPDDSTTARAEPGDIVPPAIYDDRTIISAAAPLPHRLALHPSELGEKLEGGRLGHFELREFIGGGGMGAVFRAIDTMLNRTVAVKVLSSDQSSDEETIRRFKNEAQSAARLDHENIARVYYVGEDQGVHYIVFEHIEGINLRDLVARQGPLSLADAVSYTAQIAAALEHASQRDVVHRDIKPSNVLITPGGRAKLVDMGLARLHQVEHTDNDLTASGVTLGTFDYISPEQARDPRTADVRSDLYSLGCTLYFMLTGRPPFPEGTVLQKLLKHQAEEVPDPRQFRASLPDELTRTLATLLAKNPLERYQTPAGLLDDLHALSERLGLRPGEPAAPSGVTERLRPPSRLVRAVPWLVPIVLLFAAVGLLDAIWSQPGPTIPAAEDFSPTTGTGSARPATETALAATLPVPPLPIDAGETGAIAPAPQTSTTSPDASTTAATEQPAARPSPDQVRLESRHPLRVRLEALTKQAAAAPQPLRASAGVATTGQGLIAAYRAAAGEQHLGADDLPVQPVAAAVTTADPSAPRSGLLVVAPGAAAPAYASLQAACSAAQSGDIIELRYDGPLVEKPLLLVNKRLTIRAGEGFRPLVAFQPGDDAVDPVEYPRSMISLSGGELTLINVPLELSVPRNIASDRWALFETRGRQTVSLRRCVLTVRNAAEGQASYHPNVAFFELMTVPGSDGMMTEGIELASQPVTLRINDTIARGEATFVRSEHSQPLDLSWENGLLATSERLAELQSSATSVVSRGPSLLTLQHLTAVVRQGLLLMRNRVDAPHPVEVEVKCSDSIILAGPDAALVQQDGLERIDRFQNQLSWSGDRNFYEGFEIFWELGGETSPYEPALMELDSWQQFWMARSDGDENHPAQQAVVWLRLPSAQQPFSAQVPADYALNDRAVENPAHGAASDGRDVGFLADQLPVEYLSVP